MSDPNTPETAFGRFAALVRRELSAEDVRLLEPGAQTAEAPNVLYAALGDGSQVAVTFAQAPNDREAIARRLDMLAGTFVQSAQEGEGGRTRIGPARSLHDELRALATRAQAIDAVVLDAHSPVVWGSATHRGPHEEPEDEGADLRLVERDVVVPVPAESGAQPQGAVGPEEHSAFAVRALDDDAPPPAPFSTHALRDEAEELSEDTRRAIREVRALPEIPSLHKGKTLHARERRSEDIGWVAHSFASIYMLVLVFEGEFDELRAERALHESLPRIERLVLALPPLDPTPEPRANVVSLRARRRR